MTINVDVYCKKQPTVSDLIEPLNLEPAPPIEGYETYRWVPEKGGNRILIVLKKNPELLSNVYDRECIDEHIALAKFAGIDIPEGLKIKFERDNLGQTKGVCTVVVNDAKGNICEPLTLKPSCSVSDAYTILADRELCELATQFPYLEDVSPWFKLPFGLVKFTQGVPTYEVGLEATVTASRGTLEHLTSLAGYFARAFDGIVYDTDNNKFGIPNAERLHNQGMDLFLAAAKDAKAQGAKVKPIDF
ncbi:MAG: hypothetical protein PHH00_04290 [Candidatus Nanoarchaeia archaeon]|nr:hypothetical protein [Candidatus Nanoarchaeia archaeon]